MKEKPSADVPPALWLAQVVVAVAALLATLTLFLRYVPICAAVAATFVGLALFWFLHHLETRGASSRRGPVRAFVGRASYGGFVLVFVALGLELAARLFISEQSDAASPYVVHDTCFYTPRPGGAGSFFINLGAGRPALQVPFAFSSQGLRDRVFGPKEPGEFRILLLGDSFAMGWGLREEETISRSLERYLREKTGGRNITVMNGGVSGYGPFQEFEYLKERGMPLEPDLVLLQLFLVNDIENSLARVGKHMQSYDSGWKQHLHEFVHQQTWQVKGERLMYHHSRLFNAYIARTGNHGVIATLLNDMRFLTPASLPRMEPSANRPWFIEIYLRDWYPELVEGWELLKRDVVAIREFCDGQHIRFVAVNIPSIQSIFDPPWSRALSGTPNASAYERGKELRLMREFVEEKGLISVDLAEALREAADFESLYYVLDGHLRPRGADVIAARIGDFLLRSDLLP